MTDQATIDAFKGVATASIADAVDKIAGRRGYLHHAIKPRIGDHKIAGPAVTILEGPTDDFLPPQHALDAIDESPAGSVIVISIDAEPDVAVWGGLMTAGAVANRQYSSATIAGSKDVPGATMPQTAMTETWMPRGASSL